MQTKICQLLYTFSVEYLSRLTLNYKIIRRRGAFCRTDQMNRVEDNIFKLLGCGQIKYGPFLIYAVL